MAPLVNKKGLSEAAIRVPSFMDECLSARGGATREVLFASAFIRICNECLMQFCQSGRSGWCKGPWRCGQKRATKLVNSCPSSVRLLDRCDNEQRISAVTQFFSCLLLCRSCVRACVRLMAPTIGTGTRRPSWHNMESHRCELDRSCMFMLVEIAVEYCAALPSARRCFPPQAQ